MNCEIMEKTGGEFFSQAVTFWDPKKDGTHGGNGVSSRPDCCAMGKWGYLCSVDHLRSEDLIPAHFLFSFSSLHFHLFVVSTISGN